MSSTFFTTGIGFILMGVAFGSCSFPFNTTPILTVGTGVWICLGSGLIALAILVARSIAIPVHATAWVIPLLLLLLSDIPFRPEAFFQSPSWPYIIGASLFLLLPAMKVNGRTAHYTPLLLLVLTSLSGLASFLIESEGRLIYSDDFPSFLYRLMQLKEHFPSIPFFNLEWNGGVEAREFFPSGVLNTFFLWLPFISVTDLREAFTPLVGVTLFIFVPACIYAAARLVNLSVSTACTAGIFALCGSLEWYRWSLLYGTLPFIISAALIPLNMALCVRAAQQDFQFSRLHMLLFICTMSLMCFWTPSILAVAPVAGIAILHKKVWREGRLFPAALALLSVLHIPWLLLFINVSQVGDFLLSQAPPTESSAAPSIHSAAFVPLALKEGNFSMSTLKIAREFTRNLNPLLLFLIIPAFRTGRFSRSPVFLTALLCTLSLSILGPLVKPQLELHRFFLVAVLLLILPAAEAVSSIFMVEREKNKGSHIYRAFVCGIIGSLLLYSPYWIWRVSANETVLNYFFARPIVNELSAAIRENAGEGRAVFMGFLLHEISNGHAAPMPKFTGVPLVASRYQHDRWKYTDVVPLEYRERGESGINEYLDLMNVSLIVTHERFWREWFSKRPALYSRVWKSENFVLFTRNRYVPNYFLEGNGKILDQHEGVIRLWMDTPEAVIKFNYLPFLVSDRCRITKHPTSLTEQFIRIDGCEPGTTVTIKAGNPLRRIF